MPLSIVYNIFPVFGGYIIHNVSFYTGLFWFDLEWPQMTPSDLKTVNFPVPLTIFLSLSLLALAFYINPLSDGFSSEFNFFATSRAEKCMTLKIFVKAWLSVYWVGHFFHWKRWTCNTRTSKSFEKDRK